MKFNLKYQEKVQNNYHYSNSNEKSFIVEVETRKLAILRFGVGGGRPWSRKINTLKIALGYFIRMT